MHSNGSLERFVLKIDNLTETVEKQNSTILDIEERLKEEIRLREKLLLEQISYNFSEQTSTILAKQERKEKNETIKKGEAFWTSWHNCSCTN